jgi:hypothetical protein
MLPRSWQGRSTPSSHSYLRPDGVSVEHMVMLANQVGAAPFFSMPVAANASDTYLTGMAAAVAASLAPGLQVFIEFGQGGPGWMTTELVSAPARLGCSG